MWHSFATARAEDASFRHTEMEGTMMIGYLATLEECEACNMNCKGHIPAKEGMGGDEKD